MDYVYVIADLLTDDDVEQLPLSVSSWDRKIRGYGTLSASLPLGIDDAKALDLPGILVPGKRVLYVYADDQIVWAGILWRKSYDQSQRALGLQFLEFESFFTRRLWTTDYLPVQVDQLDIARKLIAGPAKDLRLLVDTEDSGVLRDRSTEFLAKDLHTVDQLLVDLSNVEDGFDYRIDVVDDGTTRSRLLLFGYPTLGRRYEDTGLTFEAGIVNWQSDEDGLSSATEQWEIGGQVAGAPVTSTVRDTTGIAMGLPLLQSVSQDHSTVTTQATLDAYARADLAASPLPVVSYVVTVRADGRSSSDPLGVPGEPILGEYEPGDEALFVVKDAYYGDDPGLQVVLRILSITVDPNAGTVALTLAPRLTGQNWKDPIPASERYRRRQQSIEVLLRQALNR